MFLPFPMTKTIFLFAGVVLYLAASSASTAQIQPPERKPFNLGIFSGIGGLNFTPIPGVDLYYKGNILRLAPGYKVVGGGYIREILPLSKVFYNWYWIASLYGAAGKESDRYAQNVESAYCRGILLTGAKVYFSRRWFTQLQGGASYVRYKTPGLKDHQMVTAYFEFSLGVNIFKSYINEHTEEETEY